MGATASLWITAQVAKDRSWNHPRLVFSIFYTFFPPYSPAPLLAAGAGCSAGPTQELGVQQNEDQQISL